MTRRTDVHLIMTGMTMISGIDVHLMTAYPIITVYLTMTINPNMTIQSIMTS